MKKGQAALVGFTLLTLIVLVTVGASFLWGQDIIKKSVNANDLVRVENQMITLHNSIKDVANEHSQRTVSFNIVDGWLFFPNNNMVIYQSFTDLPDAIKFNPGRLILGNASSTGPCLSDSTTLGKLGFDESGCLTQKAGNFELKYILVNETPSECFGILLNPVGNVGASKGDHRVLLTYNQTITGVTSNCSSVDFSIVNVRVE